VRARDARGPAGAGRGRAGVGRGAAGDGLGWVRLGRVAGRKPAAHTTIDRKSIANRNLKRGETDAR
jgi:hypothetical protein